MEAGDVVVEVAGRTIENIYDYTYAIDALKIGEPVRIVVLRGKKRLTLDIVPRIAGLTTGGAAAGFKWPCLRNEEAHLNSS